MLSIALFSVFRLTRRNFYDDYSTVLNDFVHYNTSQILLIKALMRKEKSVGVFPFGAKLLILYFNYILSKLIHSY